jgi:hypothetical protein
MRDRVKEELKAIKDGKIKFKAIQGTIMNKDKARTVE